MSVFTFSFPNSAVSLEEVNSLAELKQKIRERGELEEMDGRSIRYKITRTRQYLYAKCRQRGCNAHLNYRMSGASFLLTSSRTNHTHPAYSSKTHMFRAIEEYLQAIPKGACLLNLKHAVCQSFGVSHKQFYYILSRLNKLKLTFGEFIAKIES